MSLDLTTLRLLKYRKRYEALIKAVPMRALDTRTQVVLGDFGRFFKDFPDLDHIQAQAFNVYFASIHRNLKDEELAVYSGLMKRVATEEVEPEVAEGLMRRLVETAMAYDTADLIAKYQAGEDVDLRGGLTSFLGDYEMLVTRKVRSLQVLDPIEDLLKAEENDVGLHWRLGCLNRHIKPIVGGDFIVIAMRPDKGKTTLTASELTFMAPQVDQIYPGENRSILWFNNEGPGKRIVTRSFQAALNATIEDLVKWSNQPSDDPRWKTKVRELYAAALGGRPGVLRIFDIHGLWNHEVEDLIRQYKPALIVFDMVDNIKFGGDVANNGQRTDQLLESMYQWAREIGVRYDCGIIATSQVSGDGDGQQWPGLSMLKDSKTGKQGAADVIIVGGSVNDPMYAKSRYMACTKNKKVRTGMPSSPQTEVQIDGDRCRFVETS